MTTRLASSQISARDIRAKLNAVIGGTQPTPTAKTADAALTVAELQTRIVTATSATAVALTLPTGAALAAAIEDEQGLDDDSFDWSVINLGSASGAVTMTASTGSTYVGSATVAIGTSARFRTRRVSTGVYVTYRVGG